MCFTYLLSGRALLWFAALAINTAIYNWPVVGWKSRLPLEILNQAGYLLVFLLSSWLNRAPMLPSPAMLFGVLFAMHAHVFGEVMDLGPDRRSGRMTSATFLGPVRAKLLISLFLAIESELVFAYFQDVLIVGFLAASSAWFVADALLFWKDRPYTTGEMRFALLAWNVVALLSMPWVWATARLTRPL